MIAGTGASHSATAVATFALAVASLGSAGLMARLLRLGYGTPMFIRRLTVALVLMSIGALSGELDRTGSLSGFRAHDLWFFLAAATVAGAMAAHPDLGPGPRRLRFLVDAVVAGLSMSSLLWLAVSRTTAIETSPPLDRFSVIAATALTFAVTRTGLAITLHRERGSVEEGSALLLTIAFGICTIGGVLHLLSDEAAPTTASVLVGYGMLVVGILTIGASAVLMLTRRTWPCPLPRRRLHSLFDVLPVTTSIVATAAMLADAAVRGRFDRTASVMLAIVVSSVLLRQSLTLSENRVLASSLRRNVDNLKHQATHDALTGLANRVGLAERIGQAALDSMLTGSTCVVCFVDIDHLKIVNDSLGHHAGDALLRIEASRLAERFGSSVTRFGGDEFVVVGQVRTSVDEVENLGAEIVAAMAEPISLEDQLVMPSSSVGMAIATVDVDPAEMLRRSDIALYRAKASGRDCAVVYSPDMDEGLMSALELVPELARAIRDDEFTLHYQPMVRLEDRQMVKVEALLRWHHPRHGVLTPDRFLAVATSAGLLSTIGEISLMRACRDIAALRNAVGPWAPSVSVNLSTSELVDRRAARRIESALEAAQLDPHVLTIEITEDVILDDTVQAAIGEIRSLGVSLAIDDFGTGNSSLRQLSGYSADLLKIDRSFVERITYDRPALAIISTVIDLAEDLGLETVAEGVETAEQADLLQQIGCTFAQGWFFGRPVPYAELHNRCVSTAARRYDKRVSAVSASSMIRSSNSATEGRSSIAPTT